MGKYYNLFLKIFFSLIFILCISINSHAMYFPEDIEDDVVEDIIEIAEKYREKTNIFSFSDKTGHSFKQMNFKDKVVFQVHFITPFFEILKNAHEAARRYKEIDEEEIEEILSKGKISIGQAIASEDRSDIRKDGLHLVLEIPKMKEGKITDDTKIIQPLKQTELKEEIINGDVMPGFAGIAYYLFDIEDLPNTNGKAEYDIAVKHISNWGEKEFNINLSKLDLSLEELEKKEIN